MNLFKFRTDCVNANGGSVQKMTDKGRRVSLATMRRHCIGFENWERKMGYTKSFPLDHDYHVMFYQSEFEGKECYYAVHSAIEYIWTKHEPINKRAYLSPAA